MAKRTVNGCSGGDLDGRQRGAALEARVTTAPVDAMICLETARSTGSIAVIPQCGSSRPHGASEQSAHRPDQVADQVAGEVAGEIVGEVIGEFWGEVLGEIIDGIIGEIMDEGTCEVMGEIMGESTLGHG